MADQWLPQIEARLDELGVDDLTIGAFVGFYNATTDLDRRQLRAMGDRSLLRFCRNLPAARYDREDRQRTELDLEAAELVGTRGVRDVLAWVDVDLERAQAALDAESETERPRSTLIAALRDVLAQTSATPGD